MMHLFVLTKVTVLINYQKPDTAHW